MAENKKTLYTNQFMVRVGMHIIVPLLGFLPFFFTNRNDILWIGYFSIIIFWKLYYYFGKLFVDGMVEDNFSFWMYLVVDTVSLILWFWFSWFEAFVFTLQAVILSWSKCLIQHTSLQNFEKCNSMYFPHLITFLVSLTLEIMKESSYSKEMDW